MALLVVFAMVVVVASATYFKLRSMRGVDIAYLFFYVMSKTGVMTFLVKTGLFGKIRPKRVRVTMQNGFEIVAPGALFSLALEPARTLKIRDNDVFLVTYPKAGTTWMQEIAWLICNNANIDKAKSISVAVRSAFLEAFDVGDESKGIQSIETWPRNDRRVIKTHLPYELLPEELKKDGKKFKIIYVARNPKDSCVSYYFFNKMNQWMPDPGTWSKFLTDFCSGNVGFGSWFKHTLKFWEEYKKDKQRIYFTTYEALKKDLRSELVHISKFLEKDLTDEQLDKIADHCTFESMSTNKSTNYSNMKKYGFDFKKAKFMRKGQVGDWKNHFTLNENTVFDAMYEEKMKETDLRIPFEL